MGWASRWGGCRCPSSLPELCVSVHICVPRSSRVVGPRSEKHLHLSRTCWSLCRECVSSLQLKIPDLFRDLDIVPALLHGDLWGGNVAEDASGPIIFDPASFYGHSEYELAIAGMFGGFSRSFYSAYHSAIPEAPGFEARLQLYQLFHYLNHWNHFGSGYRGSSLNIMRNLIK